VLAILGFDAERQPGLEISDSGKADPWWVSVIFAFLRGGFEYALRGVSGIN